MHTELIKECFFPLSFFKISSAPSLLSGFDISSPDKSITLSAPKTNLASKIIDQNNAGKTFDPNDFDVDLQDAFLADDQEQTQEPQAAAEATPETPEEQAPEGEGAEEEGAGLLVGDEELESAAEGGESLLEEDLISEIAKILDEELVGLKPV